MDIRTLSEAADRKLARRMELEQANSEAEIRNMIRTVLEDMKRRIPISQEESKEIEENVFNMRRRMGLIQPFIEDPSVNEIMINGTEGIFLEKGGKIVRAEERYRSRDSIYNTVVNLLSKVNRTVNESNPVADARLPDGSRINVILAPVAVNGPVVTVRKFGEKNFTMDSFLENGTVSEEESVFLKDAVRKKMNILVSGGTSTGKTTFLNVLSQEIPKEQRIVTIEDSAELRLQQPDVVRLETRNANAEGKGEISMRDLIKATLRLRPDRIIVGEVRDECAIDMLTALCTGHDGSMSTVHANSAEDAVVRLETLALWEGHVGRETVDRLIASGIDMIIHLRRKENMERYVEEICEVCLSDDRVKVMQIFKGGRRVGDITVKRSKADEAC